MDRIEKYLEKLVQNPRDDNINFELAYAYEKEGQYAAAVSYYLRCAEFTNNNIMASECLIRCSFSMNKQGGRDQKEFHYIKQSIGASPCSLEPYYIASLYFSWRGNYRDSYLYACLGINIYENNIQNEKFLKEINFSLPDLYCQKAMQGLKIGKINEARQIYVNILRNFDISDNLRTHILQTIENLLTQHNPILYNKDEKNKLKYQFPNCKEITENFSQIYQDMFVLSMNNGKKNGTYFEVGSAHYSINNNTFLLETQFDWQGISIDINQQSIMSFNNNRKNVGICADATSIDYIQLFSEHYKSTNIDYLQLDCDPPNITFDVLEKIPFDTYKFGVITYEHDFYNDITGSYREKSRVFLKSKGYKLICGNISPLKDKYPFEDWWIHPDIINKKIYKLFERANDDPINGEKYMLTKSKIAEDPIGLNLIIEEQVDTIKENDMLNTLKYENNIYELKNYHNKNSAFFKLYKNCPISDCVKRGHKWEEHQHNIIDKYVKDSYYCVEVGCHIGTISVKLSKSCKKLYCFEPLINSFNLLKENLELNNCNNVIIHNKGLSNENKQGYLDFVSPNNPGGTGILCDSQNINSNVINLTNKYPIELITLDSFNIDKLDYLKIDVEGYENNVIIGAFKTIKKCKPLIVMEIFENMNTYSDGQPVIPMSVEKVKDRYKNIIDLGYNVINIDQHDYLFIPDKLVNNLNNFPNVYPEYINENNINDIYKYPFNNPENNISLTTFDINFVREKDLLNSLPKKIISNKEITLKIEEKAEIIEHISFPRPNVIVIDNFYKNVDEIREYALSQTYQSPENHGAVGYRCESGKKIMDGTKEMFEKLMGGTIPNGSQHGEWGYSTNGCFQWGNARVPIVYHCDSQKYAGIIYLTPNAPPNCGTSFFRHKNYKIRNSSIFSKSDWYKSDLNHKEPHLDKTQWEIVDSVGNVYNRLVIFDAQYIHAVTEYFGEDINNSRLFQLFFFNIN